MTTFTDISGNLLDRFAFDGTHRTLDASGSDGPAEILLTGFADDVTGSAYDDLIRMAGDVRTQMFDAWRGGFVRDTAEFDGYDLTVTGGDGADTFEFVAAPRASIGRFGYDTPGDVRITDFELGADVIDVSSLAGVWGGVMRPGFEFTEAGELVISFDTYTGHGLGSVTLDHTTARDIRQAVLSGDMDSVLDVLAGTDGFEWGA